MRLLAILAVVGFVLLPTDAQYWLIGLARPLWSTEHGQAMLIGLLAGCVPAGLFYTLGNNHLAKRIYQEDMSKAETTYRSRRR